MLKKQLFLFGTFFVYLFSAAQDLDLVLKNQGDPPKVAGDNNVQQLKNELSYTGALNYSLSLFAAALKQSPINLAISYNTKGVKVSQEASDIGLGWTNNFTGTITRTINGYDDFARLSNGNTIYFNNDINLVDTIPYPFYQMSYNMVYQPVSGQRAINTVGTNDYAASFPPYTPIARFGGSTQTYSGNSVFTENSYASSSSDALVFKDFEADMYSVSVPGFSSEFVIDKRGKVIEKTITGAKYYFELTTASTPYSVTWRIVAPNGVTYLFDKFDKKENHGDVTINGNAISTWYLSQIISTKQDTVRYTYSQKTMTNVKNYTSQGESLVSGTSTKFPASSLYGHTWALDSIISKEFTIALERDSRTDVEFGDRIKKISLLDSRTHQLVESATLFQSYFSSTLSTGIYVPPGYNTDFLTLRLRLDSVSFRQEGNSPQTYSFGYNNAGVSKNSLSRDLWGYYSGRANLTSSLIPLSYIRQVYPANSLVTLGLEYMYPGTADDIAAFALNKIKYPTGGQTELTYENNDYNISKSSAYDFSGLQVLQTADPREPLYKADYPIQVFGNTTKSFNFFIPATDSTVAPGVQVDIEVVASVNDTYYTQTPNFTYTFVKIYDANNVVVYDGDAALRNITRNYFDPTGKQYIIDNVAQLSPGHYRIEYSFDKFWQYVPVFLTLRVNWIRTPTTLAAMQKSLLGPGLRVKEIIHKTAPTTIATTTLYKYNYSDSGISRYTGNDTLITNSYGILINRPINVTTTIARSCAYPNTTSYAAFSNSVTQESIDDLGYAKIEELNIGLTDTIRKINHYYVQPGAIPDYDGMFTNGMRYINYPLNGTLLKEEGYVFGQPLPLYSRSYKYQLQIVNEVWGLKYFRQSGATGVPGTCLAPDQVLKMYAYPIMNAGYIKKLEDLDSLRSGNSYVVNKTEYEYSTVNPVLLFRKRRFVSNGDTLLNEYKYPHDYSGIAPYTEMLARNMVTSVVQDSSANINTSRALSTSKTNYAFWNGTSMILPSSAQSSFGDGPLVTNVTIDSYDARGNAVQVTGKDGVTTSTIWGYNDQYIVAKIIGSNYSTAISYINPVILKNANGQYSDQQIRDETNKIRTGLANTKAQVFTYTAAPLIGMTSETDPRGNTSYYEYDGFGRLSTIRDKDRNIIKKICYNYAGQAESCLFANVAQNGNFTRNNCGSGYTGTTVTYTVNAGIHYSTVSQEEADALAQQDVASNGQAYANTHGACTPVYYNVNLSGYYTRNDCQYGEAGTQVYVNVPAGSYNSAISQQEANNLALQYAQEQANQLGDCLEQIDLQCSNNSAGTVYIILTNLSTYDQLYFEMYSYSSGILGTIPEGNYNVEISDAYAYYKDVTAGCSNQGNGYTVYLSNVAFSSSCNSIYITNY